MNNPWLRLPGQSPYVLAEDLSAVDAFNSRCSDDDPWRLQLHLYPEPFVGHPYAAVYLLGLNPGYSHEDDAWHAELAFGRAIRDNLSHQDVDYPFYFLAPRFHDSPGGRWWLKRLKRLIDATGSDLARLSRRLMCVELFPYHSIRYKGLPRSISSTRLVPSTAYSAALIRQAITNRKIIVAMRSYSAWCQQVPELATYDHCFRLNSVQNVSLSPGNLLQFATVCRALNAPN